MVCYKPRIYIKTPFMACPLRHEKSMWDTEWVESKVLFVGVIKGCASQTRIWMDGIKGCLSFFLSFTMAICCWIQHSWSRSFTIQWLQLGTYQGNQDFGKCVWWIWKEAYLGSPSKCREPKQTHSHSIKKGGDMCKVLTYCVCHHILTTE